MAKMTTVVGGDTLVTDDNVYIFPADKALTGQEIAAVIGYHEATMRPRFRRAMAYYKGYQDINKGDGGAIGRPDNRLTINYAAYNVDTFNGFFSGIAPKITLDDPADNAALQAWHAADDFVDQFSELSKQADIYGRSYVLVYQDEDGETRTTVVNPERAFMVFDDTVARNPVAFVSYDYEHDLTLAGTVYYDGNTYPFHGEPVLNEAAASPLIYDVSIPAVEFVEDAERRGVNDKVMSLINALNKAESQKANQVEYFDNAYLVSLGLNLDSDGDGKPDIDIEKDHMFYSPDAASAQARIEFLSKPDGDNIQEHLIDRLIEQIHQIAMVPNLNDEAFSGNSSGVALGYKLLPMSNKALTKERKFTPALRQLYRLVFSKTTNVLDEGKSDAYKDVHVKFTQNLPGMSLTDQVTAAKNLTGIVSRETQLAALPSLVPDTKAEVERMQAEQTATAATGLQAIQKAAGALTDQQGGGVNGNED